MQAGPKNAKSISKRPHTSEGVPTTKEELVARNLAIADRIIAEHNRRSSLPSIAALATQMDDDSSRIGAVLRAYR